MKFIIWFMVIGTIVVAALEQAVKSSSYQTLRQQKRITIGWNLPTNAYSTQMVVVVKYSLDMTNWTQAFALPYTAGSNWVTVYQDHWPQAFWQADVFWGAVP